MLLSCVALRKGGGVRFVIRREKEARGKEKQDVL
jgi:hypothetical protein